jgi:hypothetical protein
MFPNLPNNEIPFVTKLCSVLWIREILVRIHTTDLRIRIRIRFRIMLFSFVADKMPTKRKFFSKFFCLLLFDGTFTSVFIDTKSKRSHKIVKIKVLLLFLLVDERNRIRTK